MSSKNEKAKMGRGVPEMREFVSEFVLPIYQFCYYLAREDSSAEDMVLEVFRDFGQSYRSLLHRGHMTSESRGESRGESNQMKVELFQIAWRKVRDYSDHFSIEWSLGRDTRTYQDFDSDLLRRPLAEFTAQEKTETTKLIIARLRKVDFEFRAPVVLRDLLGLGDEEITRVLSLRWGVYRHRLHRGRWDFVQELHGRELVPVKSETKEPSKTSEVT